MDSNHYFLPWKIKTGKEEKPLFSPLQKKLVNTMRFIFSFLILYIFNSNHTLINCAKVRKYLCSRQSPENGKIEIKYKGRIAKFSCNPGYVLRGDKFATCHKRNLDGFETGVWDSFPECEKVGGCAYPESLENGRVLISKDMSFIKFECNRGFKRSGENGTFVCKDFSWEKHKPTCEPHILRSCDFENEDVCDWRNSTASGFFWHVHQFKTPTHVLQTGPSGDHTPGKNSLGHYLYIETSEAMPLQKNLTRQRSASIYSPMIFPVKDFDVCFIFWYHMRGLTIGTLNVYVNNILMFTKSGNQGDRWYRGVIPNLPTSKPYMIEIEAVSGPFYLGDIAVDDISITNSSECQKPVLIQTTCDGRCFEEAVNSTLCRCDFDCIYDDTCCNDYAQQCTSKETTQIDLDTSTDTTETVSMSSFDTTSVDMTSSIGTESEFFDSTVSVSGSTSDYTSEKDSTTSTLSFMNIMNEHTDTIDNLFSETTETSPYDSIEMTIVKEDGIFLSDEIIDQTHFQSPQTILVTTLPTPTEIISSKTEKLTKATIAVDIVRLEAKTISDLKPKSSYDKWKSKYSPKGRYTYSAVKQEKESVSLKYAYFIIGAALLFTCAIALSIYIIRRRKLKFSSTEDEMDVIYLTSTEEQLDFTVGRRN